MLRVTRTENGMVRGLPAADPLITVYKGIPLQRRRLERTAGASRSRPKIGRACATVIHTRLPRFSRFRAWILKICM